MEEGFQWSQVNGRTDVGRDGLLDVEIARSRPPQTGQMRATSEAPAEVMCEAADVSTGGADDAKGQQRRVHGDDLELLDLNLHWSEFDRPVLSRELVGWHAADLLRRKWRWRLIDSAGQRAHGCFDIALDGLFSAGWRTVAVVGIRR